MTTLNDISMRDNDMLGLVDGTLLLLLIKLKAQIKRKGKDDKN